MGQRCPIRVLRLELNSIDNPNLSLLFTSVEGSGGTRWATDQGAWCSSG